MMMVERAREGERWRELAFYQTFTEESMKNPGQ